jgi:hypothetical protein
MVNDLPRIMVAVAMRFYFHGKGEVGPKDLSYLRLKNPMQRVSSSGGKDLKYFLRSDAPLAKHPDAHRMYALLCERIKDFADGLEDQRYPNWDGPVVMLYMMVKDEMPDAHGGVGKEKWQAYVRCVVKALLVWQAYCGRVKKIAARRVTQVEIDDARAEGIMAYRVG